MSLWRPIKTVREDARFLNALGALGAPDMLRLELDVGADPAPAPIRRTRCAAPAF